MRSGSLALLIGTLLLSSAANAECHLSKYLDLPVTMRGARPIVSAQIDGKDAQFILDSGAFFSTLSQASAQTYGLRLSALPPEFRLRGINGGTSASVATVRSFGLGAVTVSNIEFIVGGTDVGQVGLLGQNVLGIGDVEYDLRHGVVRLLRAKGCKIDELAYWASDYPVTIIPLEERTPRQRHTIGTVTLNGVKLRAVFDTGAPSSVLKRVGVTPNSPGVVQGGMSIGLGTRALRTWTGSFNRLEIGGEVIPNPKIRFSEAELNDADMLIGADFFLTHHIYVATDAAKMLITYEGGPVFGITPSGAVDSQGKPLDLTDRSTEPTDAEGFSRRGSAFASSGNLEAAIGDFDRAIALAPNQARYFRERAAARMANHQPLLAAGDIDKALAADPTDVDSRRVLDQELPPSAGERLQLAAMADGAGLLELSLASDDAWLKAHPEDARRPTALNQRCWVLAQLDRDLKKALDDCNAALHARPNTAGYLDSRGLVRLRLGDFPGALADYNAALSLQPDNAWTLYMRSLVKRKVGDAIGADTDRRAALAIAPHVGERAAKLGIDK